MDDPRTLDGELYGMLQTEHTYLKWRESLSDDQVCQIVMDSISEDTIEEYLRLEYENGKG